jgi:hypothetical protein
MWFIFPMWLVILIVINLSQFTQMLKKCMLKYVSFHNSESWAHRKIVHLWGKTILRFCFHIWALANRIYMSMNSITFLWILNAWKHERYFIGSRMAL